MNNPFGVGGSHYNLPDSVKESYASLATRSQNERDGKGVTYSGGLAGDKVITPSTKTNSSSSQSSNYNSYSNSTSGSSQFTPAASYPAPTPTGLGSSTSHPYQTDFKYQSRPLMAQPVPQHLLNAQQQQQMLSMNPLPGYTPYNSNNRGVSQLQYEQTQQRYLQHQLQQQQAYLQSQQYQQQQSLLRQQMADSRIKTLATSGMNELIPLGRAGGSSSNHSSKVSSNQGSRVPVSFPRCFRMLKRVALTFSSTD